MSPVVGSELTTRSVRALWFATLMLAALGMTMGAAHVLELPAKMRYDPHTYALVNSTLYPLFASVGGTLQVLAIVASLCLAVRVRTEGAVFRPTLFGALCLVLSLGLWFVLVQPVNSEWARLAVAASATVADAYGRLRSTWEYGHVAACAVWFLGVGVLVHSALRTPAHLR